MITSVAIISVIDIIMILGLDNGTLGRVLGFRLGIDNNTTICHPLLKCVKVHLCDSERPDRGVHPGVQRAGKQDGEGQRLQADELLHRQHDAQLRQGEIIQ